MAISPNTFTNRKQRPFSESFIPKKFTDINLVHSLLHITNQISSINLTNLLLLRRSSCSVVHKAKLLNVLFEDLVRNSIPLCSNSIILCFEEMYIVLHQIKTLIDDCIKGSKFSFLMKVETVADTFHILTRELSTLLDIFPVQELDLNDDVYELVILIRKQCSQSKILIGKEDKELRNEVVLVIERIKNEVVPDKSNLVEIFSRLEIRDSSSCRAEIEALEEEIHNWIDEQTKLEIVALIGLVRYTKCVLFGASTHSPSKEIPRRKQPSEVVAPADYRCPISLELMQDPVVVATGQTYDRDSIKLWMDSGHNTCPKTGQKLTHTELIPNHALRNMIALWCREQKIPFKAEFVNGKLNGRLTNKAALKATKMTALFLVDKLKYHEDISDFSNEDLNGVIYELRILAKTDPDCRAYIAESGAIPLLVRYLSIDVGLHNPSLQVHVVTTILNLSILEANKTRIMETEGALNGVVEVLRFGATWEAKANAAATVFSLTGVATYRRRLGRKTRVVTGLIQLARCGPVSARRDALAAILHMAGDRETVAKLVECGAVEMVVEVMVALQEETVAILEAVVKRGGLLAVAVAYTGIKKLGVVLRDGSERARESATATLVTMCRKGGSEIVAEVAAIPGVERVIWELMAAGSMRGRRKAATLLRILRRWVAGLNGVESEGFTTTLTSPSIVVVPTSNLVA
ncbi:unnamed protein product [Lupinus luteus]|uniref:RING-type E3 ubiquitin transferase n=1 Tax=Lupinus luteus TaxID=3873 RepID=A0AAV1Y6N3_LUPLU